MRVLSTHLTPLLFPAPPRYKVTRDLMAECCNKVRTEILGNMTNKDLSTFKMQLHRIDGSEWGDVSSNDMMVTFSPLPQWSKDEIQKAYTRHEENFVHKPCYFSARVALEYELVA
mgnify:CR=1 FL=1